MPTRKVQARERRYKKDTRAQLVMDVVRKIVATK